MVSLEYLAPRWLPGGHAQTIVPATLVPIASPIFRRERVTTPDNDFIDFDWLAGASAGAPLVVLFHGLEGSSQSHYCRTIMSAVARLGWHGVVPHFRGCSGEINRAPRFYHSGDAREIDWMLTQVRARLPGTELLVIGVSLGGNALLRWLGEFPERAHDWVRAAAAISTPLDLAAGGHGLARGFNRVYTRSFLRTLKAKSLLKLEQFPGLFDGTRMLAARNLHEFDNVVTAPLHGYRDTDDYWSRASSKPILGQLTVPTLVLNAKNDPFLPSHVLPAPSEVAPCVHLEYPSEGGHVGFLGRSNGMNWLPERVLHFFGVQG